MIERTTLSLFLASALLVGAAPVLSDDAGHESHDFELVTWMGRLQYHTHKLGLAIDAGNKALAGYYIHEVEEAIEAIEKIDEYDDVKIGALVKEILVPTFERLEDGFESGDQARLGTDYDALLGALQPVP